MKRTVRYTLIALAAVLIGLIITKAVTVDAEADNQLQEVDRFIENHATQSNVSNALETLELETVSLSQKEWQTEDKTAKFDDEIKKNDEKTAFATISASEMTPETDYGPAEIDQEFFEMINGNAMTPEEFRQAGVIFWGMWKFTWYSEQVLPGEGLRIPGRWSDGDFVRDGDGYLCLASNEVPQGEIIDTPFGPGKVYDWIGDGVTGVCDIYVSW